MWSPHITDLALFQLSLANRHSLSLHFIDLSSSKHHLKLYTLLWHSIYILLPYTPNNMVYYHTGLCHMHVNKMKQPQASCQVAQTLEE